MTQTARAAPSGLTRIGIRTTTITAAGHTFGRWGETFGDDVVAAAMIDRLVHHAEILTLSGDSYRTHGRRDLLNQGTRAERN